MRIIHPKLKNTFLLGFNSFLSPAPQEERGMVVVDSSLDISAAPSSVGKDSSLSSQNDSMGQVGRDHLPSWLLLGLTPNFHVHLNGSYLV